MTSQDYAILGYVLSMVILASYTICLMLAQHKLTQSEQK
jgi:hypothetical protein